MTVNQLPGAKVLPSMLWTIVLLVVAGTVALHLWRALSPTRIDETTTLSLLHSEPMKFLVTRRTTTQIIVDYQESDWLGDWRGVLWATVQIHYGVDLQKVTAEDIHRQGEVLIVKLPKPELLDFSIEPGSVGFMSKSTAVPKLIDLLHNGQKKELERRLQKRAMEFAEAHDLMPTREEIVRELNDAVSLLKQAGNLRLRFE